MEKVLDAFSGARAICISVPYMIYNCVGFPLVLSNSVNEIKGHNYIVPSCYDLDGHDQILGSKRGLSLLFSIMDRHKKPLDTHEAKGSLKNPSPTETYDYEYYRTASNLMEKHDMHAGRASVSTTENDLSSSSQPNLKSDTKSPVFAAIDCMKACMYSPSQKSNEIMVKLSRCPSDSVTKSIPASLWSTPFSLVPPTGSSSVIVPQLSMNAGYLISVSAFAAPFSGRTRIITFQPRFFAVLNFGN